MPITAFQDRCFIDLTQAKQFAGLGDSFDTIKLVVNPDAADGALVQVGLNGKTVSVGVGSPADIIQAATDLADAINADVTFNTTISASANGDGSLNLVKLGADPFSLWLIVNLTSKALTFADSQIEVQVEIAKQLADQYCNNPFLLRDPCTLCYVVPHVLLDIPLAACHGVLQLFGHLYKSVQQSQGEDSSSGVVISEKAGDLQVNYANDLAASGSINTSTAALTNSLPVFVRNILKMYRLEAGT